MWVTKTILFLLLSCLNQFGLGVLGDHQDYSPNSIYQNPADNLKVPRNKLVEAFRDVFTVPEQVIMSQKNNQHKGQQTFPQYMLDMYKKMQTGKENLPVKANTVRCFLPLEGK